MILIDCLRANYLADLVESKKEQKEEASLSFRRLFFLHAIHYDVIFRPSTWTGCGIYPPGSGGGGCSSSSG